MLKLLPFSSVLLRNTFSTQEMREVWTEENMVQKWLEWEGAISESQGELGMIPKDAAQEIVKKCSVEYLTPEMIAEVKETVVHLIVSTIKSFRKMCGPAGEHFHVGPTTQDILDTGLVLQIRDAHKLIMRELLELEQGLVSLADEHKGTVMMGRTHGQHAVPITFGFKVAIWANEIRDHIERLKEMEKRLFFGNVSAATGVQSTFVELSDVETARELEKRACEKVGLMAPIIDTHQRTDRYAEAVTRLAELCSTLGEIGLEIRDLQRTEVMEVEEPYRPWEQYSSSTMPNKRNPEPSEKVDGVARLTRANALAMQDIQMQHERDATRMPVEFYTIPQNYMLTHAAIRVTKNNIKGLIIHPENMLYNLNHPRALGQAAAERLMLALYKKTKKKVWAHTVLHRCARKSSAENRHFSEVVLEDEDIGKYFSKEELERLMDLTSYIGTAKKQVENVVTYITEKRKEDLRKYG